MSALTENTTASPLPATQTLKDLIKDILADYNGTVAECDARHRIECPEGPIDDTPPATIADVVKCLSASKFAHSYGLSNPYGFNAIDDIVDVIAREIAAGDYNPWPDLTKNELRFLIGDRSWSRDCPFALSVAIKDDTDRSLTFMERVLADRHRNWLEKGVEVKRKRLARAKADIATLTGASA